ncbi:MAG: hypothetical protein EOP39_05970 [Rubrivivax sp.]|nr:MAG: hypothetical protein EOP39_05970 [Rubrivivax sp.]
MSLLVSFVLATSAGSTLPQCSWDRPGVNPFMGDVVAAVDRYQDIPAATREKLKARMKARAYDDIAVIERDAIKGQGTASYAPEIRDMHFGPGAVCKTVTRARWAAATQERGLVYCEDGQCILVPTVCRNVSRIRRLDKPAAVSPSRAATVASSTREEESTPLEFEAPAAGPAADAAPDSFARKAGMTALTDGSGSMSAQGGGLFDGATPSAQPSGGSGAGPIFPGMGMPTLPPGTIHTAESPPELPGLAPAVPEPQTWALIALGLLVIRYKLRQRR